jgi:hypothetical protein
MFIAFVFIIGAVFLIAPQARTFALTADEEVTDTAVPVTVPRSTQAVTPEASAGVRSNTSETVSTDMDEAPLNVKEVWLTGDTLHITVAETGGDAQALELNLSEYAMPRDEYVTIQATDEGGRESNSITFKNPYYQPEAEQTADGGDDTADGENAEESDESESAVTRDAIPFTPDGTGSVVDNVTEADGKEFFTVETPDGNTFYLIVDRQRDKENVYLLNAVTENDLASLAKTGDGLGVSAAPTPPSPPETPAPAEPTPEPTAEPKPAESGVNTGILALGGIAALIAGGAVYYFKVVRRKKNDESASDFGTEDFDDEEIDVEDDEEEDGEDI